VLSVITSNALNDPAVFGLKVTWISHELPAATETPQLFVWANRGEPATVMLVIANAVLPTFVNVVVSCLAARCLMRPKSNEYGTTFAAPAERVMRALAELAEFVIDAAVSVTPPGDAGTAAGATYAAVVASEEVSVPQAGTQALPP
jgi:hypothetical protein